MKYAEKLLEFSKTGLDLGEITIAVETANFFDTKEEPDTYEFICNVVSDIYYDNSFSVIEILEAIDELLEDDKRWGLDYLKKEYESDKDYYKVIYILERC